MEIPVNALQVVGEAYSHGWKANMEVRSSAVTVELDNLNVNRVRIVATWVGGVWLTGLMFTDGRSKPRKLRNAGEVRRYLKGEL